MNGYKPDEHTKLYMFDLLQAANEEQHKRLWIALFISLVINAAMVIKAWKN